MAADVSLSRDDAFQAFAQGATLRHLQACQASELLAAIATGTGNLTAAMRLGVVGWAAQRGHRHRRWCKLALAKTFGIDCRKDSKEMIS